MIDSFKNSRCKQRLLAFSEPMSICQRKELKKKLCIPLLWVIQEYMNGQLSPTQID